MLAITPKALEILRRSAVILEDAETRRKRMEASRPRTHHLTKRRQEALVGSVASVLKAGQPTLFANEGACRHGVRGSLCLQGWPWREADEAAAEIVRVALHRVGAVRPNWQQGQPEYTEDGHSPVERTRCVNCGGGLPPTTNGANRRFCGPVCRTVHANRIAKIHGERTSKAEYFAGLAADRDNRIKQRERDCEHCGAAFIPKFGAAASQRFCSAACSSADKRLPMKDCAQCGTRFQPGKSAAKFCSIDCTADFNRAHLSLPMRACAQCGTEFQPKKGGQAFCSKACGARASGEAKSAERRPERTCPTCKAIFRAKASSPKAFCSRRCSNLHRYRCEEVPPLAPDVVEPIETHETASQPAQSDGGGRRGGHTRSQGDR